MIHMPINVQNIKEGDYVENTEKNILGVCVLQVDHKGYITVRTLGLQRQRWFIFNVIKSRYSNDEIEAMLNSAIKMHERLRQINELSTFK